MSREQMQELTTELHSFVIYVCRNRGMRANTAELEAMTKVAGLLLGTVVNAPTVVTGIRKLEGSEEF